MHYITLRALAALVLLFMQNVLAQVEEPTLTTTTTSTTIFSTHWVIITSAAGTATTYTTLQSEIGSTIGITTITGSRSIHKTIPTYPPTSINMAWEGRSFQDAVLNSTNHYREIHDAKPLTWDDELASYAKKHSDECDFEHSGGSYGENLAQGYPSPALAIDAWANEEADYDYEKREFSTDVGHFTQLVWKNTTAVGCGAADCDDKGWLLFCEYDPAGNMVGAFGSNVGKPGQGKEGEPGMGEPDEGAAAGQTFCGRLLVALVAVSVLAGLYA